ncbi:acetyltransferase [Bhargavaea cecembensis]|uniref:Acetyltransferase n=1 Tax=Bhargavaea cecembensis TaxID=394098 RepID=A0A161SUI2_9BACL|nr:GNAT family N-acetyltransferase [Bhargavaea cecembensis]KZE39440.1 acetyltransferase [Bhargavaea cecembensis]
MEYRTDLEGITAGMLEGFFVGWPDPPSEETHLRLLRNSSHRVIAVERESDRIVGFITAVSDGVLSAYIPLLEVLPEYQGAGIGQELVRRMFGELDHLYMIDVCCDDDVVPFYERLDMHRTNGMILRNYSRQSGN